MGESLRESLQEGLGPGIGVRLEDADDAVMGAGLCGAQGGFDLGRMVGVIVNDGETVFDSLVLEAAVCSREGGEPFDTVPAVLLTEL